jgi:uncharacterized protein YndB with AHSA1/START domain
MNMNNNLIAKSSVTINAPVEKVWDALTNPALVKQYLFGTDMKTTWEIGSPITYSGEWEGKPYQDKGTVLKVIPNKLIETSYWSAAFGPDIPENHKKVSYELAEVEGGTMLTITQDNNSTEESKGHSEGNWSMVLKTMKDLLEKA